MREKIFPESENQNPEMFYVTRPKARNFWDFGPYRNEENVILHTNGQLISKFPFGVIVWTKIPTKKFDKFCPRIW